MRSHVQAHINYLMVIFLLLWGCQTLSQTTNPVQISHPVGRAAAREASRQIRQGDKLFDQGGIKKVEAIDFYKHALSIYPDNPLLHYKIGEAYLVAIQPDSAIHYLGRTIDIKIPEARVFYLLAEARSLHLQYEKAIDMYRLFRQSLSPQELSDWRERIDKRLIELQHAIVHTKQPARAFVDRLDMSINSPYDDYNPVVSSFDGSLFFTSRRPKDSRARIDSKDHKHIENIFVARQSDDGLLLTKEAYPYNTRSHTATAGISHDGKTLIIYRGEQGGNLLFSHYKKNRWTKPREIGRINSRHHETSAALSSDGNTMYFVSERPGGYGGKDIWVTTLGRRGQWSEPINLGPVVNTEYDEEGLYLAADDKTLYFSSRGHNSMGGYDIFKTTYQNGRWMSPVNLGYPINSSADDVFFCMAGDGKEAYFSSNRPDETGSSSLYKVTFLGPEKPLLSNNVGILLANHNKPSLKEFIDTEKMPIAHMTVMYGEITDEETNEPLEATIALYDNEKDMILAEFTNNPETGEYFISLPGGINYGMAVQAEDYLFYSANIDITKTDVYREVINNIKLKRIDIGKAIVLNNIFFDFDRSTLRPESYAELGILYKLLEDNPSLKVEVSGHTDNTGTASYNERLSEGRAQAVVSFLIGRGIPADRLTFKGYGSSRPIASNDTEEGRQLNRRTEFEIVDY